MYVSDQIPEVLTGDPQDIWGINNCSFLPSPSHCSLSLLPYFPTSPILPSPIIPSLPPALPPALPTSPTPPSQQLSLSLFPALSLLLCITTNVTCTFQPQHSACLTLCTYSSYPPPPLPPAAHTHTFTLHHPAKQGSFSCHPQFGGGGRGGCQRVDSTRAESCWSCLSSYRVGQHILTYCTCMSMVESWWWIFVC